MAVQRTATGGKKPSEKKQKEPKALKAWPKGDRGTLSVPP